MTQEQLDKELQTLNSKLDLIISKNKDNNANRRLTQLKVVLQDTILKLYANIEKEKSQMLLLLKDNDNLIQLLCDDCMDKYENK
jgi:hypothetical protein